MKFYFSAGYHLPPYIVRIRQYCLDKIKYILMSDVLKSVKHINGTVDSLEFWHL